MISTLQTNIPQEGGTVIFAYNLKECQGDRSVSWTETGDVDEWFDITYQAGDDPWNGTIMVSCSANTDFVSRSVYINPTVNGNPCNGILVSQIVCECSDICDDCIVFPAIAASGVTSGNTTTIGTWKLKDGSSCAIPPKFYVTPDLPEGVEIHTVTDPNDSRKGTFTVDYFPETELFWDLKRWDLHMYYKTSGDVCTVFTLFQNGKEVRCDCEYAQYFVEVLKTTFPVEGTNGQRILIGSGHTDCGYMEAVVDSVMLRGEKLENEHDENGNFYFYGEVLSNYDSVGSRSAGLFFSLYDPQGHKLQPGECESRDEMYQDGTGTSGACGCYTGDTSIACITNKHGYFYDYREYDYETHEYITKKYIHVERNTEGYPYQAINISKYYDILGRDTYCSGIHFEYDEEMFATSWSYATYEPPYSFNYSYDHYFKDSIWLYIKPGAWDGSETAITLKFKQYTDGTYTRGYPCDNEYTDTVYITTACTCSMESDREYECNLYYRDKKTQSTCYWYEYDGHWMNTVSEIPGQGGEFYLAPSFFCADSWEAEYDEDAIDYDGSGNVEIDGSTYFKVKIKPNSTIASRLINVTFYPVIGYTTCWDSGSAYECEITQRPNFCTDCEAAKNAIHLSDTYRQPCCTATSVTVKPFYLDYYYDCQYDNGHGEMQTGRLNTTLISIQGNNAPPLTAFTKDTYYQDFTGPIPGADDSWTLTFRTEICTYYYSGGYHYTSVFPGCYVESQVIIDPCINCEDPPPYHYCNCSGIYFREGSVQSEYPSGYGNVTVGTADLVDSSCDGSIWYEVKSTQEGACTASVDPAGGSVVATINDVSSSTNIVLTISGFYNNGNTTVVCQEWRVAFLIRK